MKNKTGMFKMFIVVALLASLIAPVSAFGVSTPYWVGNDLYLLPGESKVIYFELQNMIGDNDVSASSEILKGQEILTFPDPKNVYEVPAKTQGVLVPVRVSIPSEIPIGTIYPVSLQFRTQMLSPTGGMVGMSTAVVEEFNVYVGTEEKIAPTPEINKPALLSSMQVGLIFAIIAIAGAAYILTRKKRKI